MKISSIKRLASSWKHSEQRINAVNTFVKTLPSANKETPALLHQALENSQLYQSISQWMPQIWNSGNVNKSLTYLFEFVTSYESSLSRTFSLKDSDNLYLLSIFKASHFLSRFVIRYPGYVDVVLAYQEKESVKLRHVMMEEVYNLIKQSSEIGKTYLKEVLRRYKYQEFLRITLADINKTQEPEQVLQELSNLSVVLIQFVLYAASQFAQGKTQLQLPSLDALNQDAPFCVIGMGKLGGDELNYSSDIDLVFLYDDPDFSRDESNYKWRNRAAKLFIEIMSEVTELGFLYRVDMRLRPGGEKAALVQSLDAAEYYYSIKGEPWERQAWIKAKVIAGDLEAGKRFLQMIAPFVYNKFIDQHTVDSIHDIKNRIEQQHLKENQLNVKLGVGGIREIEFFAQVFQLLYAGKYKVLRSQNTLYALRQLALNQFVPESDIQVLVDAYLYLRTLEHRIQMLEEHQTHLIPLEVKQQNELARSMGFEHEDIQDARHDFLSKTREVMSRVRSLFSGIFSQDHLEVEAAIRNSIQFKHFSDDVNVLIHQVSRDIASVIRSSESEILKTRFQNLFEVIGVRLEYYEYLLKYPAALSRLCRVAETSEFLWSYILKHLNLIYRLETVDLPKGNRAWRRALSKFLDGIQDEEERMDQLRSFKYAMIFLIGSAELDGVIAYEEARRHLSHLACAILQEAYEWAFENMKLRYGEPVDASGNPVYFAALGMGKIGGQEVTYHSDLDLIFLYSGAGTTSGKSSIGSQEFFVRVVRRLISILSTFTRTGVAYELDTRLRPSGHSGVLVSSLESYISYHQSSQPWEHQALLKARFVAGSLDAPWVEKVAQCLQSIQCQWKPPKDLHISIAHLRSRKEKEIAQETSQSKNIKEGYGGLLDVEYLVQYYQLKYYDLPELLFETQTTRALKKLSKLKLLDKADAKVLLESYQFLRKLESYLRLLFNQSTNRLDFGSMKEELILSLFSRSGASVEKLQEHYQSVTQQVRTIYHKQLTPHSDT